eukprot:gene14891-biopygen12200
MGKSMGEHGKSMGKVQACAHGESIGKYGKSMGEVRRSRAGARHSPAPCGFRARSSAAIPAGSRAGSRLHTGARSACRVSVCRNGCLCRGAVDGEDAAGGMAAKWRHSLAAEWRHGGTAAKLAARPGGMAATTTLPATPQRQRRRCRTRFMPRRERLYGTRHAVTYMQ